MKVNSKSSMPASSTHLYAVVVALVEEVFGIISSGQNA